MGNTLNHRLSSDSKPGDMVNLDGSMYEVLRNYQGYNSFILILRSPGGTKVVKVYGEKAIVETSDLGAMLQNLVSYCERLRFLKVNVPPIDNNITVQANEESGRLNIILRTPYKGSDFEHRIKGTNDKKLILKLMHLMLECTGDLLTSIPETRHKLLIGIDMIPRNFVGENGKDCTYCDLMPPKIMFGGKRLLEWPPVTDQVTSQIGIYRHYDKMGIMHVLLAQMTKLRPEYYPAYVEKIEKFLTEKKLFTTLDRFNDRLVATRITGTASDTSVIQRLGFRRIYDLREIAGLYTQLGLLDFSQLNEIFNRSHFQSNPIPEKDMKRIRKILLAAVPSQN